MLHWEYTCIEYNRQLTLIKKKQSGLEWQIAKQLPLCVRQILELY